MKSSFLKRIILIVIGSLISSLLFAADRPYKKYEHSIYDGELIELRLNEVLPSDAAKYVHDYRYCRHWQGEDAYDKERSETIKRGINESCSELDEKKKYIERKYPEGSTEARIIHSIIKEIDAGESFPSFVWNDPERESRVLNEYYEAKAQSVIRELGTQIPKYEAAFKKLKDNKSTDNKELETRIWRLKVQQKYLKDVIGNIDRLHPLTRGKIKTSEKQLDRALSLTN